MEKTNKTIDVENETLCQAVGRIQREWKLTDQQMAKLTHVDEQTYIQWISDGLKSPDGPLVPTGMPAIVPFVSICKVLEKHYPQLEDRQTWLFRENSVLSGNKPIDVITSSVENLYWVSYCLSSSLAHSQEPSSSS
jgi:hypothetical protein